MRKPLAFLRRDFLIEASYRFNFLLSLAGLLFSVTIFYFLGKMVDPSMVRGAAEDYFSFSLVGMALTLFLRTGLGSFSISLREEQLAGTLEAVMSTPTSLTTIVLSSSLWRFLFTSLAALAFLGTGLVFGVSYAGANWGAAALIFVFTIASFASLGIISASFTIIFKRGDPVNWAVSSLSVLLGGVFYPVSVLPEWLRPLSRALPITWSLDGLRGALLMREGFGSLRGEIAVLAIITAVLLPLSLYLFHVSVNHARTMGTLSKY
ncbi:MAG: ABC transporter permease [Actinomycetota bacterium]